jgi:hypothetical protein
VSEEDLRDRQDLRHVPFTTIDPETARDFDDAVALDPCPTGGHRLWVAVADVSHYVREGEPIDVEAEQRGLQRLPAQPGHPHAARAALRAHVLAGPRAGPAGHGGAHRPRSEPGGDRDRLLRGGDPLAGPPRLPGGGAALGGDTRGKRKKYERFLPALQEMDALAARLRARGASRARWTWICPRPWSSWIATTRAWCATSAAPGRDPGERRPTR